MTAVRAAVIGLGHHGYHHARIYNELEGVSLVGVFDHASEVGERAAKEFGVPHLQSVEAVMEAGAEAVSVAVPTSAHHAVVLELAKAGAHILVEKPIAQTVSEAEEMVAASSESGRILQVGHIERFNGAVVALMESIKRPRFIECHRLSPYPNRGQDVSVVHDLMIHDLDIVLALTGSEVTSVDAVGVAVFSEAEDIANVRLRFESGCVANLTASRVSVDRMRKIRIFEENAYVSTDYSSQEVVLYRKKPGQIPADVSPMEMISIEPLSVSREEPLRIELSSFIDAVREGGQPAVSGEDGVRALKLAEQVIDSLRANAL